MAEYLIGIDIGTSATKTLIMDQEGKIAAQATASYAMSQPANGWAEQDPEDWRRAAFETVRQVVRSSGAAPEEVKGLSFSGQMHGLVMLDEEDRVIRPAILWCDQRSAPQVEELLSLLPEERWMEVTANPPIAAWTAAKVLWVRQEEPEHWARCRRILLPKDYVRYCMTGVFATDVSDASGMQMLDVRQRKWSGEVLKALKIPASMVGTVFESQEAVGTLTEAAAEELGLTTQVKVIAGAADNAAAAVGTGVVNQGEAFTTIGTSALVYTHLDQYTPVPGGGLHLCCCALPGGWFTMGGPQAAGLSLEWFKDSFCEVWEERAKREGRSVYDVINEEAESVPPGSERLFYLPFLMGERTPHMNPSFRGAFIGLNLIHKRPHLIRAIMEGVAYSLADCNDIVESLGYPVTSMKACGGGSRSRLWRQLMADLYGCAIQTIRQEEGPAYGAAILAGVGAGVFSDVRTACSRLIQVDQEYQPDRKEAEIYKQYHQLFKELCQALTGGFKRLYEL